jgi:hypothetical protein
VADIVALRRRVTVAPASTALHGLVRTADEVADSSRTLPVLPLLRPLLPGGGLRRGATVAVAPAPGDPSGRPPVGPAPPRPLASHGGTSLLLALLAAASRAGSWCAVVGVPTLGGVAAAEFGVDLGRLALVPNPGPEWTAVVAALLDGMDIVAAAPPGHVAPSVASRLAARARQRGSVLVPYGRWEGADVTLEAVRGVWYGVGQGHGRLRARQLTVAARGRGAAVRPKQLRIWLPAPGGGPPGAGNAGDPPVLTPVPGLAEPAVPGLAEPPRQEAV